MPAYRFCRTDDIPLLVDALNACYAVHFREQPKLSVSDFKREIRELSVWSSSCMIASDNRDPIAVVTGAKREHETLIHRIGVRPDCLRRGHASHLLESLGQKFSILGPPRVVAELPEDLAAVRELFESVGFRAEERFADFALAEANQAPPTGEVGGASLDDLLRYGLLGPDASKSWERALESLQNRKNQLQGLVVASGARVGAYLLFRDLVDRGRREILALGAATQGESDEARNLLASVVRFACRAGGLDVTVPRVGSQEISWGNLESLGFRRGRTYTRYAALASSFAS